MLGKIIEWSARNRFLIVLATLFVALGGIYAVVKTPLDALPDLSDVQVIIYTEYPGQAPQVVEDQVTYPLTTAMLSVPKSKVVRGFSFFGEGRQGPAGWSVIGGLDLFDPDGSNDSDSQRRLLVGGAHWSQISRARLGVVVSLEQTHQTANSQLLSRRLLAQTHIEF